MKNILLLSALLIFACSSDSDEDNRNNESLEGNISKVRIVSLTTQSDCTDNGTPSVYQYEWESEWSVSYSNNTPSSLLINDSRFLCETNENITDTSSIGQQTILESYDSFQYEDGNLKKICLSQPEPPNCWNFNWSNGDLIASDEEGGGDEYFEINYSQYQNNTKYNFPLISGYELDGRIYELMLVDEYRGLPTINLPSSIKSIATTTDGSVYNPSNEIFYNYEFNESGKPVRYMVDIYESYISNTTEIITFLYDTHQFEITYTN